jgi:hypothetical protein
MPRTAGVLEKSGTLTFNSAALPNLTLIFSGGAATLSRIKDAD